MPLDEAARRVGPRRSLQGNLDPAVLLADRATVDREVRRVVEQGRAARGHIFNLGHGVLPDTDPGVLTHVVELVHELTRRDDRPHWLVVVGAGITGLAAAFEWRRRRPDDEIVVLEAGDRIGGKLHRVELAGHWYDTGAEAVLARVPEAVRAGRGRSGSATALVAPATTQASVVLPDGRHPLPAGTVLGVPASADGLDGLPDPGRRRAGAGRGRRCRRCACDGDVAVGALLRERLGDEVVDRLVEPLLGGVYAGRADELSLAATMPALAAQLPRAGSVLAAAAAARDAGARSRGDADGPVFATVRDGHRRRCRRRWSRPPAPTSGCGRRRTALRRTATGFELSVGPGGRARAADRRRRAGHRARPRRPPGCWARSVPGAVEPLQGIPYASMAVVAMAFPAQDVDAGLRAARAAGGRAAGQGRDGLVGEVAAPGRRRTSCWCARRWAGSATRRSCSARTTT